MNSNSPCPLPTEKEIKDRRKSNWLAKALVLLQMTWFVMQYVAQGVCNLPITELKVMMLAYMTMSLWDIFVWWDKPLNVGCLIQVFATTMGGQGGDRGSGNVEPAILKAPNVRWQLYKLVQELQWRDVGNFIIGEQDGNCDMFTPKVPTFWLGDLNDGQVIVAGSITLMVGIIF